MKKQNDIASGAEPTEQPGGEAVSSNSLLDALMAATAASYDPTWNDDDEIIVTFHFPKDKESEAETVFERRGIQRER